MAQNTVFLTVRGDQIGRFGASSGDGNGADRVLSLRDVVAFDSPDTVYTIRVDQVKPGEDRFRNGQFVTILDSAGKVVVGKRSIQPDAEQGLGAGGGHLVLGHANCVILLSGVPASAETVTLCQADRFCDRRGGQPDGHLHFADVVPDFPCFLPGTLIGTPQGDVPVETLRVGDSLLTIEGDMRRLIWIGRREIGLPPGPHPRRPVAIARGALGSGLPLRDLSLSPQHRVLLAGPAIAARLGDAEVLAPAKGLLGQPGIRLRLGLRRVTYISLLTDRHCVIRAEGAAVETFYPGPVARAMLSPGARRTLEAALAAEGLTPGSLPQPARRLLKVQETRALLHDAGPLARLSRGESATDAAITV